MEGGYYFINLDMQIRIREFLDSYWYNPDIDDPEKIIRDLSDSGIISLLEDIAV